MNWVKIEDGLPKDNGRIQKILVCINRKSASYHNCSIELAYFTDHFHTDWLIKDVSQITHWCYVQKPDELQ